MKPEITRKETWGLVNNTIYGDVWVRSVGIEPDMQVMREREGYGAHLSTPGYLDCTEWMVCDSPADALLMLHDRYVSDPERDDLYDDLCDLADRMLWDHWVDVRECTLQGERIDREVYVMVQDPDDRDLMVREVYTHELDALIAAVQIAQTSDDFEVPIY